MPMAPDPDTINLFAESTLMHTPPVLHTRISTRPNLNKLWEVQPEEIYVQKLLQRLYWAGRRWDDSRYISNWNPRCDLLIFELPCPIYIISSFGCVTISFIVPNFSIAFLLSLKVRSFAVNRSVSFIMVIVVTLGSTRSAKAAGAISRLLLDPLHSQPLAVLRLQSPFIPLDTFTSLPTCSTQITELSPAPTSHMVTSHVEFHESLTAWACLPLLTLREFLERFIRCIDFTSFPWVSQFFALRASIYKTIRAFNFGNEVLRWS